MNIIINKYNKIFLNYNNKYINYYYLEVFYYFYYYNLLIFFFIFI